MTIKDIAKLAGVSISTVSKIMNGKDQNIHPDTRARVLQIVKEYNYSPYSKVKNMGTCKKFLLGVLLRKLTSRSELAAGILEAARQAGYGILLLESLDDPEIEAKQITILAKNSVDGVLWEPVNGKSTQLCEELVNHEIPFFYINSYGQKNSFVMDYQAISYALTRQLLEHGHSNIVCILDGQDPSEEAFAEGFRRCLYDNRMAFNEKLRVIHSGNDFVPDLIHRSVTGAVVFQYDTALMLYHHLFAQHYSIPMDFSLVSLKEHAVSASIRPQISSIGAAQKERGRRMCDDLIRRCEHTDPQKPEFSFCPPLTLDREDTLSIPSSLHTRRFVVVGSINADMTFYVDQLPQAGTSTQIINSISTLGGKGANQSVGISRLNHAVSLIGELGNDSEAAFLFESLGREKVNTVEIHRDSSLPTGRAFIFLQRDGESAISLLSGANSNLTVPDLKARSYLFERADFCLISSEIPVDTVIEAARLAHEAGVKTLLKPAALERIPEELYPLIDFFIPNRKEAAALCPISGASVEQQASYFRKKGIPTVIITLGHRGCYLDTQDAQTCKYFPAPDVTVVDTTGGADAFISALAAYMSDGYSLEKAIRIATYAAGFCISRQGVFPALIDKFTLESRIVQMEPELLSRS